jgi:RimJ/RimL family protein N-acetyltransferase
MNPVAGTRVHLRRLAEAGPAVEYAIEMDGRVVGNIQSRQDRYLESLYDIGIDVSDEADRGHGLGREALSLLVARLFDHERAHRVQLSTDVENTSMRRAAEAAGFTFEGVLRGFWPPTDAGPATDYAMYAMTKRDYEDVI